MILIGQYDSPFVRRVGIALTLYRMPFEHRPWSVFRQADEIRRYNPLIRVPTLVLDDGEALLDSHAILDHLDSLVPASTALFPKAEPARHKALRIASLACGMGEKAVTLFYEQVFHKPAAEAWVTRCRTQVTGVMAALEAARAGAKSPFWFGDRIGHADIAVASMIRFIVEAHPGLIDLEAFPALSADAEKLEATPAFQQIRQTFVPPA